jgi:hypothetical protein
VPPNSLRVPSIALLCVRQCMDTAVRAVNSRQPLGSHNLFVRMHAGYKNEWYAELVNRIFIEPDNAKRKQKYSHLNDILTDDAWMWSIARIPLRIAPAAQVRDILGVQANDAFHNWSAWLED